ncbi:hypothetical protein BX616_000828 [Lobosporangium transversale]|uniref:Amidohydrolase-related domain-containing protein n=1 Tax=Lobosporangium transversale TaxID=64571 RepID=A0A1Y2GIY3_9FUNG|nr:hypothetical protein BCR41DRAFT_324478 [Lobosporangium transversale]KAF9906005.1 hypothetical protein BX616_000828 [Lobosporangium transversale]ORZ12146.1 hypothetical protein BCR41DRAFT_324478 [Lobosporangium transversale]|eukprot:XP_021880011.1 hypothetical protein BCR41DRAFT_324478 [Lobosporangium transversale]
MADYTSLPQHDQEEVGHAYEQPQKGAFLRKKSTLLLATAAIALLATSAYFLGASNELSSKKVHFEDTGISSSHFAEGLAKCKAIRDKSKHKYPAPESRSSNPRFVNGTAPTLFRNAYIFDGVSEAFKGDLLIDRGIIVQVGGEIKAPTDANVVDLKGHILTPGIVDMHSHFGVGSWPELDGTEDSNEMTQPLTPFIRSIDGFNPSDLAREWILSGGVTTSLILPGSGNIMGGEAYAVKLRKVDTLSTDDMLVEAGVDNKWRYMKMACGENPKRFYGGYLGRMPSTRLGEGWLLRNQFAKATELKRAQDDWCDAAEALPRFGRHRLQTPFPEDLQYESLVGILRDDVKLNIHCYETHDLEAMVRHSNEYKFKISAFHHGLDAYRVPEILKRAYKNVPTVATFAGKFGYKKEALQSSVNAPKTLADAGIPVAMKSDHPVLNSQHLVYEAAQAHHYGLSELLAIASVTSVPAKALGLDHRIGKIAVGYDADLAIWEKHPLALGAHPLQVYIDGVAQIKGVDPSKWSIQDEPQKFEKLPELVVPKESKDVCSERAETGVFKGIKKLFLNNSEQFSDEGDLVVVIDRGEVICTGHCQTEIVAMDKKNAPVYDLGGEGVVLPSLLSVGAPNLGLIEIAAEDSTGDGHHNLNPEVINAADGLKFGGLHMDEAYKAGILTAVTAPESEHVIQGVSVAFLTGAEHALSPKNAIVKEKVALHVKIGHQSKSTLFPTISSQIAFLRTSLEKSLTDVLLPTNEFSLAAHGKIPLVVEVDNRDEIIRLIQLKKDLERSGARIKVSLLSAVEAWTVAEHLAEADISVILRPYLCTPAQWTAQRCLPGAPLSNETGLSILYKAGVKVGLAAHEPEDVRQLSWIAGWARSDLGLKEKDAVGLVSWNLAEIVGLPTNSSGLVLYNGNPFEFGAKISAIIGGGKSGIQCNPRAF